MLLTKSKQGIGLLFLTSLIMLFMTVPVAHSAPNYQTTWGNIYTLSSSVNASCQLCHASSTQNLNPYGKAICDQTGTIDQRIAAVENADSDGDPSGSSNITEINADTQPGWTTVAVPIYDRNNCSTMVGTETAPGFIVGPLDPVSTPTTTTLPPTPTTTLPPTTTTTLPPTSTTTLPPTTTTLAPTTTTTTLPSEDLCPDDPNKTEPGVCGCGRTDVDSDSDGIEDCIDNAPYTSNQDQADGDLDGVGDAAEQGPNSDDPLYDGNNDGTPDIQQSNVSSLFVNYGQDYVTISTDVNNSLENVSTLPTDQVADLPAGVTFPFDLFGFTITGVGAGNSITVTIFLPDGEAPTTYWKYGPTPLDGTNHWYKFLYDGTAGAELDGNVITLHFVDGERGDHDLDATNGIIDDPGGPALVVGSSSSSGCFIATAAYGSYMEPHVITLRHFRDSYLLTNRLGTTLVEAYYKYSPPLANYIAKHDGLRSAVRVGLTPLVGFSWLAINYGMMYALAMLFSMLTIIIGVAFFIVRTREAN